MARYLVVAHQTVTNPELLEQVRSVKDKDEQAEFVLLVPATPVRHLLFLKGDERDAQAAAEKLAAKARAVFARHGVDLRDAKVGAESPVAAIEEEVGADPDYAGFIISTLPRERSRWLRMDLPRIVESKYGKPVYTCLRRRNGPPAIFPEVQADHQAVQDDRRPRNHGRGRPRTDPLGRRT